jgi:hypothetical protein
MRRCISCGRIIKDDTAGNGNKELKYCSECLDENGKLKTYDEVAENLAKYLIRTQGLDEKAALNAAKAIASSQSEWDKKQGVYFEKDMKKRKNAIIALVLSLILFVSGTGFGLWYFNREDKVVNHFEDGKDHLITREVDSHTVYELDLPGFQSDPLFVYDKDNNKISSDRFVFCSSRQTAEDCDLYDLYGYDISNNNGKIISTGEIISPTMTSNDRFIFLETSGTHSSVHSFADIYRSTVKRSIAMDSLSPGRSQSRPYHPQLAMNNKQFEEYSHMQVNDKFISWCIIDEITGNQKLLIRNFDTLRTIMITDSVAPFSKPFLLKNHLVWEDNRDVDSEKCSIYSYNLESEEEKKIFESGEYLQLCNSKNDRFVLFFTYKQELFPKFKLIIFDLYSWSIDQIIEDEFWTNGCILSNYSRLFPIIIISRNTKKPFISWGTFDSNKIWKDDKNYEYSFPSINRKNGVAVLQLDAKREKPLVIERTEENSRLFPIFINEKYVISQSESSLWITDISTNNEHHATERICFLQKSYDSSEDLNCKIENDYIFWNSSTIIETEISDGYFSIDITGSNICWAKISDIFPENTNAAGMEE